MRFMERVGNTEGKQGEACRILAGAGGVFD